MIYPGRVPQPMLLGQLRWIVGLRWLAGSGVVIGGIIEHQWLKWYSAPGYLICSISSVAFFRNILATRL